MKVEVRVADTGVEISKELHAPTFEKFRQADSADTRTYEGVGIGLYMVWQFTGLLGGNVKLKSEPGKDPTFTVTIPSVGIRTTEILSPGQPT